MTRGCSLAVTRDDIQEGVRTLGLSDRPLCVHSSLRSFGRVEGGADAVIDGLLAEGCTVVVPTFSESFFAVDPPPDLRPPRNGWDYETPIHSRSRQSGRIYDPATTLIDRDMGAIPAALVSREGRVRGDHPLDSFAAIGPLASDLIREQSPDDVYAPFRALAMLDGSVLLIGVGLTRMTLLHQAEKAAGRTLFRRWALDRSGHVMLCEVGGCSEGFDALEPVIGHLAGETVVGNSRWRAFPAAGTIAVAAAAVQQDPLLTHCRNPDCRRCRDAAEGGPILM